VVYLRTDTRKFLKPIQTKSGQSCGRQQCKRFLINPFAHVERIVEVHLGTSDCGSARGEGARLLNRGDISSREHRFLEMSDKLLGVRAARNRAGNDCSDDDSADNDEPAQARWTDYGSPRQCCKQHEERKMHLSSYEDCNTQENSHAKRKQRTA